MNNTDLDSTQALGRKIRLKHLLDEGLVIENMVTQQSSVETLEAIRNIIVASDNIVNEGCVEDRAEHTTEVVMDAQVLKMSHELVSKVLLQSSEFNDRMYQNAINSLVYRDDEVKWSNIAEIACSVARTSRIKSTLLGALDIDIREHVAKERQQRKRQKLAEEKRPESVEQMKRQDKGAHKVNIIHQQVANIFKNNNRQPIPYYNLIIDPLSFMNTVENAFQLAFLARDSIISIERGDDGYPHVRLVTSEERKSSRDTVEKQSICTLSTKICNEMMLFYDIKEPMLNPLIEHNAGEN